MKTRCPNCGEEIELDAEYMRKLTMAELGARTSKKKAATSADNGAKGGRPKKQPE